MVDGLGKSRLGRFTLMVLWIKMINTMKNGVYTACPRSLRVGDFICIAEYEHNIKAILEWHSDTEVVIFFSPSKSVGFEERPTQRLVDKVEETAMCEIAGDYEVGIIEYHKLSLNDQHKFLKHQLWMGVALQEESVDLSGHYIRVTINRLKFTESPNKI